MSDGYQVDAAALDGLIQTLDDAASDVRAANAALGGYPQGMDDNWAARIAVEDDAGSQRMELFGAESLADAASGFADKWRYGLDKLEEAAEEVVDQLEETRRDYLDMEEAATGVFQAGADMTAAVSRIADALGGAL